MEEEVEEEVEQAVPLLLEKLSYSTITDNTVISNYIMSP